MSVSSREKERTPETLSHGLRFLIVTQSVDTEDSILGFFVRWIEEFAKHSEKITVVCLRKGKYSLPKHVEVIALGDGHRIRRAFELCSLSLGRRSEYDAVFAHMSPEFVVAAGWLWRLMGKKVGLWYVHKSVTMWLRIAVFFSNIEFTAAKESFRLATKKLVITGHGIDTDFFKPDIMEKRGVHLLSVGRLYTSKRHDLVIDVAAKTKRQLRIVGDGPEKEALRKYAEAKGADVQFLGGLNHDKLRTEYRHAYALVHTSETGGLDKVVLEAAASALPIVSTSPVTFAVLEVPVTEAHIDAIVSALDRVSLSRSLVQSVRENHSLESTVKKIIAVYDR